MQKILIAILIIAVTIAGCRSQKDLIYFPNLEEADIINPTGEDTKNYKIRPGDLLYIRVLSPSDKINKLFNSATGSDLQSTTQLYQEGGMYYNGYSVNNNGSIDLPEVGEVAVSGKTIEEASEILQKKASEQLIGATIIVKLANMRFTLLGEVNRPGTYLNYKTQTTILEALGMAGDLTDYGDRKRVLVIRPTNQGSYSYRLNLNDEQLISSPNYYLKPNDVVYVQPLKAKANQLFAQDTGVFFSIFSTTMATASLIVTIILNLKP